jgi:hypothetical protein
MEVLEQALEYFGLDRNLAIEICLPTPGRLAFQEEILNRIEPGILNDPDLNLPGTTQLTRLQVIYNDLGIPANIDIIQGLCPQSTSISHLLSLVSLLNPAVSIDSLESNMNFISNNPLIFEKTSKLFISTFPTKFSPSNNTSQELLMTLEFWKQELKRISIIFPKGGESELPENTALKEYQRQIEGFSEQIKVFRMFYQESLQRFMTEGDESGEGIGKWSRVCVKNYEKIEKMLENIEGIWSAINTLVNR